MQLRLIAMEIILKRVFISFVRRSGGKPTFLTWEFKIAEWLFQP